MRQTLIRYSFFLVVLLLNACTSPESRIGGHDGNIALASATVNTLDTSQQITKSEVIQNTTITVDSSITKEYLIGKFDQTKHPDFVPIKTVHASRGGMYLRKEAYENFVLMAAAAKKEDVHFIIKSATRNFDAQKVIWEGKWNGNRLLEGNQNAKKAFPDPKTRALKILEYSSMPGTSRHHWGTDFDVNAFTNGYFEKGKGLKEYEWLLAHAGEYGFCQPYTAKGKDRPDGYNEEKWHWSYLPIAKPLSDQYKLRLANKDISGFEGSETALEINVVEKYVLGINEKCL